MRSFQTLGGCAVTADTCIKGVFTCCIYHIAVRRPGCRKVHGIYARLIFIIVAGIVRIITIVRIVNLTIAGNRNHTGCYRPKFSEFHLFLHF